MKATSKIFILFLVVNLVTLITPQKATAQVSINFQLFYDNLSPYGYWVDNPDYGYVWIPNVSDEFTPYGSNGYWVFTNVGWTWVSNYSWGWAPFHYGRWFYDSYYGWLWVPGDEWGPGWVTWRRSEGYYGWAPIGPGISITIAYSSRYRLPYNQWTFVRDRDFGRTNIYNYYVDSSRNTTIINNSTVINNIQVDNSSNVRYNAGPDRTEVQRRTGTTIAPVSLRERNKPGQNLSRGELQIYKPRVGKNYASERKPAPSKVVRLKDVKPAAQRNARQQQPQRQRDDQQTKQQPQRQRNDQPAKQQQPQRKRDDQQAQQQRYDQQAKQQQEQQRRNDQQAKQQQEQQRRNDQQAKQQQEQQRRNDQQAKQQQEQQRRNEQQAKQPQTQQPRKDIQAKKPQPSKQPIKSTKRDTSGRTN
jgi:hypothetical protein